MKENKNTSCNYKKKIKLKTILKIPAFFDIFFQRLALGLKTLFIGIVISQGANILVRNCCGDQPKQKRSSTAHQLFKWSIEVMKTISLISASIGTRNITTLQDPGFH